MRYLLDTHAVVWWAQGDARLSGRVRSLIENDTRDIGLSVVSAWELQIKQSIGKLELSAPASSLFTKLVVEQSFSLFRLELDHIATLSTLANHHRDPFDRVLVAQAISEECTLVTKDSVLAKYGVKTYW